MVIGEVACASGALSVLLASFLEIISQLPKKARTARSHKAQAVLDRAGEH
jgi:hypothetical protein